MTKEGNLNKKEDSQEVHIRAMSLSLSQGIWIFVTGLGIGWLAGLSVSPVVAGIITSLLGIVAGVVTGYQMIRSDAKNSADMPAKSFIDPRPAALLVLGIALAAPCGILVRTFHILEPKHAVTVSNKPGSDMGTVSSLIESNQFNRDAQDKGVLYADIEDECESLLTLASMKNYEEFLEQLKESNIPGAREMVREYKDKPETIEFFLRTICHYYKKK